jgi:dolichol-phosphate mannosyltransferase
VDDNSPDRTYQLVLESFRDNHLVHPLLRTKDKGFAKSIRRGIEEATGDFVLVMDTDFTHPPSEICKMLYVAQVFDVVTGSRFCVGGSMPSRRHYLASLIYNWLIRLILRTQIQDNLSGFFVVNRHKLNLLPFDEIFYGYGEYFFRLLFYAERVHLTIVELPTKYSDRFSGNSKSNFAKLLFSYTMELLKLKRISGNDHA